MKKLLFLSVPIALVLYSCVSKTVEPDKPLIKTSISATVDGVYETFNSKDTAQTIGTTGIYISGTNDTTKDKIILIFSTPAGLAAGTYTSTANGLQMLYGLGPGYTFTNYYFTYNDASQATVTVAAVGNSNVNGTFSGNLVLEQSVVDNIPRPLKAVTNGKFNLTTTKRE